MIPSSTTRQRRSSRMSSSKSRLSVVVVSWSSSSPLLHLLLLISFILSLQSTTVVVDAYAAMQSGPDVGPSYSGGMVYDKFLNIVYFTGATYGSVFDREPGSSSSSSSLTVSSTSSCFLGIAQLPTPDTIGNSEQTIQFIERETYGTTTTPESCTSLSLSSMTSDTANEALSSSHHQSAYLIGGTEEGGLLTNIRIPGSHKAEQYGFILDVTVGGDSGNNPNNVGKHGNARTTALLGGALLQDEAVQYPIAIVTDPTHSFIYIVSQHTEETTVSDEYNSNKDTVKHPNYTSGGIHKFGNIFSMIVERMEIKEIGDTSNPNGNDQPTTLQETLRPTWRKPFGLVGSSSSSGSSTKDTVHVAGMIEIPTTDTLVIVGSTKGSGPAFGEGNGGTDMDGFFTKLHTGTGEYVAQGTGARPVHRLDSINQQDEWITSICSPNVISGSTTTTPTLSEQVFYIVGATTGQLDDLNPIPDTGEYHAFVSKIDLLTLNPIWTKQLEAPGGTAYGLGCSITSDNSLIYVGGGVENGASLIGQTSNGGDDFFVAQFTTNDGSLNWAYQVGTDGDDWLAHGGCISVDKYDNAIVYGDTTGAMYRPIDPASRNDNIYDRDIFVGLFLKDNGDHIEPSQFSGVNLNGGDADGGSNNLPDSYSAPPTAPMTAAPITPAASPPTMAPVEVGGGGMAPTQAPVETTVGTTTDKNSIEKPATTSKSKFILVTLFLVCSAVAAFFFAARFKHQSDVATERGQVFAYLQGFDVEDVDLRHSATGGWHGTYVNRLAHGVNKAQETTTSGTVAGGGGDGDGASTGSSGSGGGSRSRGPPPASSFSFESAPLTHSSVVKDSLFMDVDSKPGLTDGTPSRSMSSSSAAANVERGGYDNLVGAYDENWNDLGPRSYSDQKSSLEAGTALNGGKPYGKEIV